MVTVADAVLVDSALPVLAAVAVDVSVTQFAIPSDPRRVIQAADPQRTVAFTRETFASAIGSWGVEVSTEPSPRDPRSRAPMLSGRVVQVSTARWLLARGRLPVERRGWARAAVRRRPSFHGRTQDRLDILVTTRQGEWTAAGARRARLHEAVTAVTSAAQDRHLTITGIRSPSAGFSEGQWRTENPLADPTLEGTDPHLARGLNARVTIALDDPTTDDRIGILARLLAEAEDSGWGLHVADRRYGALRGHWVCLRGLTNEADPGGGSVASGHLMPVTVFGPSRRGSQATVVNALAGLPLIAITATTLADVDVVHAIVEMPLDRADRQTTPTLTRTGEIDGVGLGEVRARLGLPGPSPGERASGTDEPEEADDAYVAVLGIALPAADLRVTAEEAPIWLQYEVRELTDGAPEPEYLSDILDLFAGRAELAGPPTVEYHRQRWVDARRRLRIDRVKLAVRLVPEPHAVESESESGSESGSESSPELPRVDDRLLDLCEAVQNAQRIADTGGSGSTRGRIANFRVAARERWLGSWLDA
jgi:hypothetical protein